MKTMNETHTGLATAPADRIPWDGAVRPAATVAANYVTDRMHRGVFALAIGSYLGMLVTVWLFFTTRLEVTLTALVFTTFFGMYFGVPVVLNRLYRKGRTEPEDGSFIRFVRGKLETISGRLTGKAAIVQVLIIPVSTTCGLIAMAVTVKILRAG